MTVKKQKDKESEAPASELNDDGLIPGQDVDFATIQKIKAAQDANAKKDVTG